ncbi:MAG TPA: hypothetical protein VEK34_06660 [Methylocella sp.]|nr:hypothetical protein [Methylocella sp.]
MKNSVVSGTTLAVAAIALAAAGISTSPASAKKAKTIMCMGINSCKGTSACKTAENACKGQNSCKGHGWLPAKSKKACESKGGTVI